MTQGKNLLSSNELQSKGLKYVLCDIDDTLTNEGKLFSEAYQALWSLERAGFKVTPITGRPAGWCELIARLWPVDGVVGENGAFYFYYAKKTMVRKFIQNEEERKKNNLKLQTIKSKIFSEIPKAGLASDQFCRTVDLAIDFCEDVPALPKSEIEKIVSIFEAHGANAKVSSIHVNGWFGDHDKLTTTLLFLKDRYNLTNSEQIQNEVIFIGDSPNDEPMFKYFQNSVGVSNIAEFLDAIIYKPKYITQKPGGLGFQEFANKLLT
jgi:HAD superfamily hydrolase (TIGR01484 family)